MRKGTQQDKAKPDPDVGGVSFFLGICAATARLDLNPTTRAALASHSTSVLGSAGGSGSNPRLQRELGRQPQTLEGQSEADRKPLGSRPPASSASPFPSRVPVVYLSCLPPHPHIGVASIMVWSMATGWVIRLGTAHLLGCYDNYT